MLPSDLSFGYLSAELKSPVKIPILDPMGALKQADFECAQRQSIVVSVRTHFSMHFTSQPISIIEIDYSMKS